MTFTVTTPAEAMRDAAKMGKPYLNIGCGKVILPAERPMHHVLIDEAIYSYPDWVNVDRNAAPGVDKIADLCAYPWPLESNSYGGALITHFVEHIPHEIRVQPPLWHNYDDPMAFMKAFQEYQALQREWQEKAQDGWYAFFAELYRVLTDGAIVHILSPYAWSAGAIADPTHTRLICEHSFTHQLSRSDVSPYFQYKMNCNFEMVQAVHYNVTEIYGHLAILPNDADGIIQRKHIQFQDALMKGLNVVYELYVKLRAVK